MTVEVYSKPTRVSEYLELAHQKKWTGTLKITTPSINCQWKIYFKSGRIIWSSGGEHWLRRFRRLCHQYCPHIPLKNIILQTGRADYTLLQDWLEREQLTPPLVTKLIESNFAEILFDILQKENKEQLNFETEKLERLTILPSIDLPPKLKQIQTSWQEWCESGLEYLSPNYAPVKAFQHKNTPSHIIKLKHCQELIQEIDGDKSLRDIALVLRKPLLSVGMSLNSLFQQEIIEMYAIPDLPNGRSFSPLSPNFNISVEDLLSNRGVICARCNCGSNSIIDMNCSRCGATLVTKALPGKKKNNISFQLLIPILFLLLLAGGVQFMWQDWEQELQRSIAIILKHNCSVD